MIWAYLSVGVTRQVFAVNTISLNV